jgi:hypothetical protein
MKSGCILFEYLLIRNIYKLILFFFYGDEALSLSNKNYRNKVSWEDVKMELAKCQQNPYEKMKRMKRMRHTPPNP